MSFTYFDDEYISPLVLSEQVSKTPRYYQANVIPQMLSYLKEGFLRILVKSPTGSGKTFISKLIAISHDIREQIGLKDTDVIRVLYIANKHRLNRQAIAEYEENHSVELITQSAFSDIPAEVIERGWDLCFIDECHHEAMSSIQMLLDTITHKPIIGFTAEDSRGDGLLLKFERVIVAISEEDAANRGFIEKVGCNTIIDTGTTNKAALTCDVLQRYHTHMGNTIIFLRTESEAKKVYTFLRRKLRLTAAMINSKDNEKQLDAVLDRLASGEIQFLVNCQKVSEGVDVKNVTDIFVARHFNSAPDKKQYIGRGIRPDGPCAVWELINPLEDSVCAKSVVGVTKYERLIYVHRNEWKEQMISGVDPTWGQMSNLRVGSVVSIPVTQTAHSIPDNGSMQTLCAA